MLTNTLKITILLMVCANHCSSQFELKSYHIYPEDYDYEESAADSIKSKLKDSELYNRYRMRRHFMPQRFGKRFTKGFIPQRFGKRLYEKMNL
ncbi:unnamed protein product [Schistosoma turkestanicum]|nr:unnamed protein product [Schistosoma turkestanicum]CAH8550296.1 unnamed protein product [Schistosoma turkestanicum]